MSSGKRERRCSKGHGNDATSVLKGSRDVSRPKSGKGRGSLSTNAHGVNTAEHGIDDIVDGNGALVQSGDDEPSIFDELSADISIVDMKQSNTYEDKSSSSSLDASRSADGDSLMDGDALSLSDYVHILNDASDRLDSENVEDMNEIGGLFQDIYNVLDARKSETMELCRKLERMKTAMTDVKGKLASKIESRSADKDTDPSLIKALNDLAKVSEIASETESFACQAMMETERVSEEANNVVQEIDDGQQSPLERAEDSSEAKDTEAVANAEERGEGDSTESNTVTGGNDAATEENDAAAAEDDDAVAEVDATAAENDITTGESDTATGVDNAVIRDNDVTKNDGLIKNEIASQDDENTEQTSEKPATTDHIQEPVKIVPDNDVQNIDGEQKDPKEETPNEIEAEAVERNETPPPPPRPKSPIMNNKDRPLEWPHFTMHLPGDDELTCFVRCRDCELRSSSLICSLGNISGDALGDSEEVISNCVTLSRPGHDEDYQLLSYPIVIAIPYQINARVANTKELVVKQRVVKEEPDSEENSEIVKTVEWKILQPLTTDSSLTDYKGQFVEVAVTRLTSFAVVARMANDKMTISKRGGVIKSIAEHRVTITYPQGACTLMSVSLQVQPAESVANDLKTRFRHCSDLIGASPILHMTHTPNKKFDKPVTVDIPCPPNPNKGNTPATSKSTKSEKKELAPMLPEGAIIIRKTKKSSYGGDAADDFLHALYKQSENGAWNDLDKVEIKQVRKDVVSLDLKRPVESLLVLRMGVETKYTPKQIANTFEQALQVKYANIILYHKVERPEKIIVQIVPIRQLDSALRRLNNDDYDGPPDPSPDIPMTEGQEITIRLTGNVKIVGHDELKLTFHTQRTNTVEFTIKENNKFGNYSSSEYRGVAEFYGRSRVAVHEPDDPEEILLREAEAKAAEKHNKKSSDFGGAKGQKEQKAKEKLETNVSRTPPDLLCKLAVSIPKSDPDPLMPPSRYRTIALDGEGMVSNENLRWLSKELGSEWETLAAYLGLKRNRMQSIKRNNPLKTEAQILDMLITWRSMMPKAYNKERKLCVALVKCGRYDLSDELKERKTDMENNESRDEEEEE